MTPNPIFTLALRALAATKSDTARVVDVVASTGGINWYGYMVDQSGWDLSRYEANPVVLYGHNDRMGSGMTDHNAADTIPIGRGENVRVEDGELRMSIRFASAAVSDLAERCYQAFSEGMLNAVSVGFEPIDVVMEMRDGEEIPVVKRAQLLEVSVVPIPADPGAVATAQRMTLAAKIAAHTQTQMEFPKMTPEILAALELSADAAPTAALGAIGALRATRTELSALSGEIVSLTGAESVNAALGLVRGWKLSAEKLATVEGELSALKSEALGRAIDELVATGKCENKLTPALEAEVREIAKLSLERASAMLKAMPVIAARSVVEVEEPEAQNTTLALKHDGKSYEELSFSDKAALEIADPPLFGKLRADWRRRGSPRV